MSILIKINGDGLNYEAETSIIKASQVIAFLNTEIATSEVKHSFVGESHSLIPSQQYNKSPRDAIQDASAKTNPQKILVFAKYHMDRSNNDVFDPSDLKIYFRKAGEPMPGNFTRDIKDAVSQNFIYEENMGQYVITDYGVELLANGFESVITPGTKNKRTSSKSSSRKTSSVSISDNISSLEITPKMEGMVSYHDTEKKVDKILWILYFASEHGCPEVSPQEIEYLASKLLDKIPAGNVPAFTEGSRKKAYVTKTKDGKYKLLYDGIEYIKQLQISDKREGLIQEAEGK